MVTFKTYIQLKVTDKDGHTTYNKKKACKSFVLQFLQLLQCHIYHRKGVDTPAGAVIKSTAGATHSFGAFGASAARDHLSALAIAGEVTIGIVLGLDSTPPTNADFQLGTLIAEGAGANQLNYGAQTIAAATIGGGGTVDCPLVRSAVNNSGADITIEEVGYYISCVDSTSAERFLMILRDITGPVIVPHLGTVTATYIMQTVA
jgi:hypothetical protein